VALRLSDRLGVDRATASQAYYASMLLQSGYPGAAVPARALQVARRLPRAAREHRLHMAAICEVSRRLSARLGMPAAVQGLFEHLTDAAAVAAVLEAAGQPPPRVTRPAGLTVREAEVVGLLARGLRRG